MDLVGDWRVSSKLSGSDHKQIHFALKHVVEEKWDRNPRHIHIGRMDLEEALDAILKKAPFRFCILDNL